MLNKVQRIIPIIVLMLIIVGFIIFSPFSKFTQKLLFCRMPNPWVNDISCDYEEKTNPHFTYCGIMRDPKCFARIFPSISFDESGNFSRTYPAWRVAEELKKLKMDNDFEPLLNDEDWQVREGAIAIIGFLNRQQSKKLLYDHLDSDNAPIVLDCFNGKDCLY